MDLLHFALTFAIVALGWRHMMLATLLLALISTVRFVLWPRGLGWFAFGFVFASLAEIVQVWAGVYDYAQACPLIIPYYNFFLWGVVLSLSASLLSTMNHRAPLSLGLTGLAVEVGIYLAVTALLCACGRNPKLVAGIFAAVLALRLGLFYRRGDGWFLLVGMLAGPLTESCLVGLGIYHFADPALHNLPLWHPLYWGIIILFLRRLVAGQRMVAGI